MDKLLPFDWSNGPATARDLVELVASKVRTAAGRIDGRRFLGALGSSEAELDEILDWLKQGGPSRRRAVFCDGAISAINRAVFFTWLASEWAYFSWVADDRNFWPRLTLDVFGEQSDLLSFNDIYQQLRLGFGELKLGNHLDDSETAWCYVESLRRQSGFPRAWWDCVYRIVQDAKYHRDVRGNWTTLLQQQSADWPRSFCHAARAFPEEVNAFFDAVYETINSRSGEPLRKLNHAFAREADALAEFLRGDGQFGSYVEKLRKRRARRHHAFLRRSALRFWIDSLRVGIGALQREGRWRTIFAAYLPDTIPRERLPREIASATALTLSARAADFRSDEVRYDSAENGLQARQRPPVVLLNGGDGQARLVARATLPDGTRCEVEVARLFAADELPAMFYLADARHQGFYAPAPTLPEDRTMEVPQGQHALLVLRRGIDEVACDPEPVAVTDLGASWTVRVLPPPTPSCDVLIGEDLWRLSAKPPLPGELLLDGPRLDETAGERIFTSWPCLRWEGSGPVRLHSLRIVPAPQAANHRFERHLVEDGVLLEPGRSLDLNDLRFTVADDPATRLPREFIGSSLLRVEVERASERWALTYSFKLIPPTELCPGPVEMEETWQLPLQVVARGVETLELTPRWQLTAGGVAEEETREAKGQGHEVSLETSIPIQGLRLVCRLRYGFRGQLPRDFEPGFAIDLECSLSGPLGFLVDAAAQPKLIRPLGAATILRVDELVMHSLVLADFGSTEGGGFCLALGDTSRPVSSGEMSLAHVRQEVQALCRRHGRVTAFLESPGVPRRALFTVLGDAAVDVTTPRARPMPLHELVHSEDSHADRDAYLRSVAQAVMGGLVCPAAEHVSWERCWPTVAHLRLRDFGGWEPSREIHEAYQELSRSRTHIALPWLWRSWGLKPQQAENDLVQYPLISQLVERLEGLGRSQGFGFLPALLVGAQDLGPDSVSSRERDRMRYLIAMLCTGCRSSMAYRALSMKSVPEGPRSPDRENVNAPWWVSKPEHLKYPLAWELFRVKPDEHDLRTLKVCRQVKIDDPRSEYGEDASEGAPDLTYSVIDLEQHLAVLKHHARWVVRAALACSQEWARYVVHGDDVAALDPLLDAFRLVCKQAPVLTRVLCIDAVLHEMDRYDVGWATWDASRNDGQGDLEGFPELRKHLKVPQVN